MLIGDSYQKPLRCVCKIIEKESLDDDKVFVLVMVVNSIIDLARPDGLVPKLLVFEELSHSGFTTDQSIP